MAHCSSFGGLTINCHDFLYRKTPLQQILPFTLRRNFDERGWTTSSYVANRAARYFLNVLYFAGILLSS